MSYRRSGRNAAQGGRVIPGQEGRARYGLAGFGLARGSGAREAGQARIELIRVHLALADLAGARTLMAEVDELLRRRPGLGTLPGQAEELRAQLSRLRGPDAPGASALTAAELRLLPMLATHLSFPQIAEQMSLSRHTVKAEATSIYRKLGASSRDQAVMRARDLGLLDG